MNGEPVTRIDDEMLEFVEASELPFVLTRLSDYTIQAASAAYFDQIAVPASEVLGASVFSLMDESERARAREALGALADGTIDFYRTYRPLSLSRTHRAGVYVWSHAIDLGPRRYALTQILAVETPAESPLVASLGYEPALFAFGIMDPSGIVTSVSNDLDRVIGVRADELIGHYLLPAHQRQLWSHFHSAHPSAAGCAISLPFEIHDGLARRSSPSPAPASRSRTQCLLVCLANSDSLCFILSRDPAVRPDTDRDRSAELEGHLLRIAREVQASGVLGAMSSVPDPVRFPQLRTLNSRQWDVLTRLLRGDRVPAIADEMFLSQSAVRNHLSEVFRRFGVHSQSELLALLRS